MSPRKDLIAEIFLACRARIARAVSRIVPPHDIEDIVQETYVRVCRYNKRSEINEPQALMVSVARNLALDYIKRVGYRRTTHFEADVEIESTLTQHAAGTPYDVAASDEDFSHFCDAVRRLPLQCRRVFVLKKVYGYSQQEIARELGLAESTVEKHIASGMHHCIRYLSDRARVNTQPGVPQQDVASTRRGRS